MKGAGCNTGIHDKIEGRHGRSRGRLELIEKDSWRHSIERKEDGGIWW